MQKHFVEFYSPGTFVSETSLREITEWDVDLAAGIAREIKERYDATPYGFRFITRQREENDFDSREVAQSGMYFLGGRVWTLAEIEARHDSADRILIANMRGNEWDKVVENSNSYKITLPLNEGDVVLNYQV